MDHSKCDYAGRQVTCDRCKRTYRCTPSSDYYCTPEDDHCCEPCLLGELRLAGEVIFGEHGEAPLVFEYDREGGA
jgi:hypothetical protein